MHILQLVPSLEVGGVERGVVDLAKGLVARGHTVSVVSSGGPLVERLTQVGARHERLPVHERSLRTIASCIPAVARLITTTGVDLVHARSRIPAWIGLVAARRTQRPFVTTAHGFYRPHVGSRVMVWGQRVIAPSESLGRYLIDQLHLSKERLRVIPRGVDLEEFAFQPSPAGHDPSTSLRIPPHGPWRIGLFGRLSPLKGHAVALRACERLVQRGVPVQLFIAGDTPGAPAREALEALIAQLKLEKVVEWLGVRHDMAALIGSMDLIVVPSTYPESFGRGVIEAQAVGRPVVASRLGALADLVEDGTSGLLVSPGDPAALAEALERLINDPVLRARCVDMGRARVEARWSADRMVHETLSVYEECLTRPRIVVWKLSALGDIILSIPSLRALRQQFPEGHLAVVVGRSGYAVVGACPYLNDIIIYDAKGKDRGPLRHLAFVKRLRRERFDRSIDLQNSRRTHLLAWLAGIPVRVGYRRKFGWLLNRSVRLPRVVLTPIAHQQYLFRQAGLSVDGDALELWPSSLDEETATRLLGAPARSAQRPLVGLHPGGSGRWKTKRWDLRRWAQLCNALAKRQCQVVVVGGKEELALGEALKQTTNPPPLIVIGQTSLMELACLIKRCAVFVAHDSSSLHVAAAVGTPTIALFGPTDPQRHLPPHFSGAVIKKDVFCSPCYSTRCRTITHACMNRIGVEEVLRAILDQMAETESRHVGYVG